MTGKRGCGSRNKTPFVAAVETHNGNPMKIHLRRVAGFRKVCIKQYAQNSLQPGSIVYSDGLRCFYALEDNGCDHIPAVTSGGKPNPYQRTFKWGNTIPGNLKNSLTSTFHTVREKHTPRYLAEFENRFHRRFDLESMIQRFLYVSLRTPPMPHSLLKMAEVYE